MKKLVLSGACTLILAAVSGTTFATPAAAQAATCVAVQSHLTFSEWHKYCARAVRENCNALPTNLAQHCQGNAEEAITEEGIARDMNDPSMTVPVQEAQEETCDQSTVDRPNCVIGPVQR